MMTDKQNTKPEFTWHKIDSELRVKKSSRYFKIPLKPTLNIALKDFSSSSIQTRLHIDIEKSLQFQQSIGWNWHKSSNLPIFSLKLSILNIQTGNLSAPPQLQAHIYAVKIVQNTFQKGEQYYLQDIGIKGESKIQLIDGCGYFNSLRFSSTSYNNEGVKFHLLVVIFNNQNSSQLPQNIICSVISPPIFVDSRKSARNYQEKKYMSFVELFNPNDLQKLFSKKDSKQYVEEKKIISNSDEGLFNYLTAPNIRHKVKHPLFLSVRFSNAFQIYFNPNSRYFREKETTLNNVINRLQKKLIKEVGMVRRHKNGQRNQQKQFAIVLIFELMMGQKQKILQMLEYLDCQSIFLSDKTQISEFIDITEIGDIITVYKSEYNSLKKKSERQFSQRKLILSKKQEDENVNPDDSYVKGQTMIDKIKIKQDQRFSLSNQSRNQSKVDLNQEKKANMYENMKNLGLAMKKIKLNEQQLMTRNQYFKYPLHQHLEQRFMQDHLQLQRYQNYQLNFSEMEDHQIVKQEQNYQTTKIYVSKKYVVEKIKSMCAQVYQRNKKSILNYLETLKKSNIKWKVKDVQHFIFQYSSALMNAVHFRERLLHHMFLENQIVKAKVGIMQQMALADLQKIKGNIMSMNNVLPQSFIIEKLKQNQLWNGQFDDKTDNLKVAQVKSIEGKPNKITLQTKQLQQKNEEEENIVKQTPQLRNDESLSNQCNFVSNVFELQSPSVRQ